MKWPKRLIVVRHGYSVMNEARELSERLEERPLKVLHEMRDFDVPLTDKGREQATATGKYLARTDPLDAIYVSPYRRTVETAERIALELRYRGKLYRDNRLREKESGWIHGLSKQGMKVLLPDEAARRARDGKYFYRPPGGESYPDVEQRVHSFLDKLHRDNAGQQVLVVTHAVPYLLFRALFEHWGENEVLESDRKDEVPNCGIALYVLDRNDRMKVKDYNRLAY